MFIETTTIDREQIAKKLAKKSNRKDEEIIETLLNNGVSKEIPEFKTINIDKYC